MGSRRDKVKVAFLGLGAISGIYLKNLTEVFDQVEVIGVYDLLPEKMKVVCETYKIKKAYASMEELLEDEEVEIVLNLTRPYEHYETTKKILQAGKHVYTEKPLAATYEEGVELVNLAKEKERMLAGAPDTFLGAGIETCKKLIEDGYIGRPIGASVKMLCHGHETWHPSPAFYYQKGGGPMMDMGPYYVTALVYLLGGVEGVMGITNKSFHTRTITSNPLKGDVVKVEVPTHYNGIMEFKNGAIGTITTTFDVYYDKQAFFEIYGTEGTLRVPDPNCFSGEIQLFRPEEGEFKSMPKVFPYAENSRGIGLANMSEALREGTSAKAGGEQILHVLEILCAFEKSSQERKMVKLETTYVN